MITDTNVSLEKLAEYCKYRILYVFVIFNNISYFIPIDIKQLVEEYPMRKFDIDKREKSIFIECIYSPNMMDLPLKFRQ